MQLARLTPAVASIVTDTRDLRSKSQTTPELQFHISTYPILAECSDQDWATILRPAHEFLRTLSSDDKHHLVWCYSDVKHGLTGGWSGPIEHIVMQTAQLIDTLEIELNLLHKLRSFIVDHSQLPLPTQAQLDASTDIVRFTTDDYIELLATSLLAKLLFPIWGELSAYADTNVTTDKLRNQTHCLETMSPLHQPAVAVKFYRYIAEIIRDTTVLPAHQAVTWVPLSRVREAVYTDILVRHYAEVDLSAPEASNLLRFTRHKTLVEQDATIDALVTATLRPVPSSVFCDGLR